MNTKSSEIDFTQLGVESKLAIDNKSKPVIFEHPLLHNPGYFMVKLTVKNGILTIRQVVKSLSTDPNKVHTAFYCEWDGKPGDIKECALADNLVNLYIKRDVVVQLIKNGTLTWIA